MNEREVNMSKLKTKRKKHYLAAAMLAMLAVATPITLYGSVTTYAQTDDAAGAESGVSTFSNLSNVRSGMPSASLISFLVVTK